MNETPSLSSKQSTLSKMIIVLDKCVADYILRGNQQADSITVTIRMCTPSKASGTQDPPSW